MSREKLKKARKEAGLTQQQMADMLGISLRYYQNIETGDRTGDFVLWDTLEDITGIHQRILRELSQKNPGQADNREKHQEHLLFSQVVHNSGFLFQFHNTDKNE